MTTGDAEAFSTGTQIGQLVAIILPILGIAKCWSISRRPTTNAKCVWALMLLLAVWAEGGLMSFFKTPGAEHSLGYALLGLSAFVLLVAAVLLAVLGLVEYSGSSGRYTQGRAQAIWTLVLCAIFTSLAVAGFMRSRARRLGDQTPLAAGTPLIFEDCNFKFSAPGRPWGQVDAVKLNPYAKLALVRANPEIYFVVSAEPSMLEDASTESLAELTLTRMKSLVDNLHLVGRRPVKLGGLDGLQVEIDAQVRNYHLFYVNWFCFTNGWAFQLMSWGQAKDRQLVAAETERLLPRFELVDYQRRPKPGGQVQVGDFVSTNYQFAVHCNTPEWLPWGKLDQECPYASFGVLHRDDAALVVTAVGLVDLQLRPETVYRAMLELIGLGADPSALPGAHPVREKNLEGIETSVTRQAASGKNFEYRVKILQGGGYAYLVAAWAHSDHAGTSRLLGDAVARAEFFGPPSAVPETALLSPRERRAQRLALNSLGTVLFRESRFAQAARCFQTAVRLDDSQVTTPYLVNFVDACVGDGRYREALDELERNPARVEQQPPLQAQRAFLQGRLGQTALALTNYARLFASGFNAEDHFREYVALRCETEDTDKILADVETFLKKQDSPGLRQVQALLLKRAKRFTEAVALLKEQREKNPFNLAIACSLGDAYIQAGRPNEALSLSQEVIRQQGNSGAAFLLKGRSEFALKWYREAKESFERAAKESPGNLDVKYWLDAVSAVSGEGANAMVKEFLEPVAVPAELLGPLPEPPADFGKEEGAYYVRRLTATWFERGKGRRTTDYLKVKTLNAAGVAAFSTFQLAFNPLNEDIFVNEIEVRDEAGSLVSTGRVADSYVLDEPTTTVASSHKMLNVPVPGLQSGYIVSLTYTRREIGAEKEFSFLPFSFSRGMPVQESVLYLCGETGAVRYASVPEQSPETIGRGLCWRRKSPPVVRWEPLLPTIADYTPMVWVSDASANWPAIVTNYLDTIRDRLVLPAEQRELAIQLTSNAPTASDKVAVIASYVQTNYTYKAIEFGRRARVPQALADTVHNRYGDCKDHAVILQQMLNAAGIPASLALVNSGSPLRRDMPSLDQFDHMLVYLHTPAGEAFLDCTAKSADLRAPWSLGLAAHEALVLDSANPRFVHIAAYPTNASHIRTTRAVALTNQTDAVVQETVTLTGVHAGFLREYLRNQLPDRRRAYVSGAFIGSGSQLTDVGFDGLELPQAPLAIHLTYLARGQFQSLQNQIVGSPPLGFERTFLVNETIEKRVTPFEVAVPLTIEGDVTISVAPKFKPRPLREAPARTENGFVNCAASIATDEKGWRVNYRLFEPARRFPAAEYAEHCRAVQQAVELLKPRLVGDQTKP